MGFFGTGLQSNPVVLFTSGTGKKVMGPCAVLRKKGGGMAPFFLLYRRVNILNEKDYVGSPRGVNLGEGIF